MTRNRALLFLCVFLLSCEQIKKQELAEDSASHQNLWVDKTAEYLPATGEWTNRVEVADLNGDNQIDLIFASGGNYSEPGSLESSRIFINQGPDSQFEEITSQVFKDEKYYARVIKVRDLNNDSIPDMLVGTTFETQSQLYIGLGDGNFKNVTTTQLPQVNASVGDVEFGDVDDDGDLDIALSDWGAGSNMNNTGGRTMLWLNDGKGFFADVTQAQMPDLLIQFSWDLEFIDYDNDFDLDIAISCKRCGTSRLFENNGEGGFTDKRALPAYTNNYEFEPMDINGDGFLDLVTINDGEIVNKVRDSRREHIFLNNNGENFIDATEELWPPTENIGKDDNNIVFLDYDSDGDPDFLVSSLTGEDRLLINDGTGKFKLEQPVLSGAPTPLTLSIVLGDINNDKKIDIIMGQGEGEEGIEERIFMGESIAPDAAPPIISNYQIVEDDKTEMTIVKARIHDNKSPNMPQDWNSVNMILNESSTPLPMTWYGENLWVVKFASPLREFTSAKICAIDYSGNKNCVDIKQ